jgi:hypothetical protein
MLALKRLRLRIRHAERQRDLWEVEGGAHYTAAVRLVESLKAEEAALVERTARQAAALEAASAPAPRSMRVKRAFTRLQCPHCKCSFKLSVQMLLDAEDEAAPAQPMDSEASRDSTPDSQSESTRSKPSELV